MKKRILMLCLLLFGLFAQVSIAHAVSETYDWHVGGYFSKYEIFIVTQDHWKTDTTVDVTVRLTLTDKHWSLDHTVTNWMQVTIRSLKFRIDSGKQREEVTLTNEGDYWEKTIPMQIPSAELEQGEKWTMSIAFTINIDEMDNVQSTWSNIQTDSSNNPIYADVTRPMFWESSIVTLLVLVIGLSIGSIVVSTIVGIWLYRRRRKTIQGETVPKA